MFARPGLRTRLASVIALSAVVLLSPASDAAQRSARPAAAQPAARLVPFVLHGDRIYLQVSVNGLDPRPFILDSGAQITHFTSELVRAAALRTSGNVGISGVGTQRIKGAYVSATILNFGDVALPVRRGISGPGDALFGPFYEGSGRRFDGVIGYDLFARYVVEIDYPNRTLRLHEPATYRYTGAGEILPIRLVDKKPYVKARLTMTDGRVVPANLQLDTGQSVGLRLNADFVAAQELLRSVGPTIVSAAQGVGGINPAHLGRIRALQLGANTIERPIAMLLGLRTGGVRSDSSGAVGIAILRRFTVVVDYSRKQVILQRTGGVEEPFEIDMSGAALVGRGPDLSIFTVQKVDAGTPAAEAGVLVGDVIVSVDGRSTTSMSLEELRRLLRREGEERVLGIRRGSEDVVARVRLRRRL